MGNTPSVKNQFSELLQFKKKEEVQRFVQEVLSNMSSSDEMILNAISHQDIQTLLTKSPLTLASLLQEMTNLIAEHAFKKNLINVETRGLNTCLRVMARLFPVILQPSYDSFIQQTFWTPFQTNTESKQKPSTVQITSYGVKLLLSISRLLFMEGYTIDKLEEGKPEYVFIGHLQFDGKMLWKNHDFDYKRNEKAVYIRNRIVLLQTISALFSKHFYQDPSNNLYHYDAWTLFLVSPKNTNIFPLVYSLLNSGLSYGEGKRIPFKTGFFSPDPDSTRLSFLSLQILNQLLEMRVVDALVMEKLSKDKGMQCVLEALSPLCNSSKAQSAPSNNQAQNQKVINLEEEEKEIQTKNKMPEPIAVEENQSNYVKEAREIFRNASIFAAANIVDNNYTQYILKHVIRILSSPYDEENSFFPGMSPKLYNIEETLLVLWRIVECNKQFEEILLGHQDIPDLVQYLLYQMHTHFEESPKGGLFNLSLVLLTRFSTVRAFYSILSKPYMNDLRLPDLSIFVGTYADLIFNVIITGILLNLEKKTNCYCRELLSILSNIAPYLKELAQVTCSNILVLVRELSKYEFLFEHEANCACLVALVNLILKILTYQGDSNLNLLYELLVQKRFIYAIKKLNFSPQMIESFMKSIHKTETPEEEEEKNEENDQPVQQLQQQQRPQPQPSNNGIVLGNEPEINQQQGENQVLPPREYPEVVLKIAKSLEEAKKHLMIDHLISVVEYLQSQTTAISLPRTEEKVKEGLKNTSLAGILVTKQDITVEDSINYKHVNTVLKLFNWTQIISKNTILPQFNPIIQNKKPS